MNFGSQNFVCISQLSHACCIPTRHSLLDSAMKDTNSDIPYCAAVPSLLSLTDTSICVSVHTDVTEWIGLTLFHPVSVWDIVASSPDYGVSCLVGSCQSLHANSGLP
jgi:hypothetical protein